MMEPCMLGWHANRISLGEVSQMRDWELLTGVLCRVHSLAQVNGFCVMHESLLACFIFGELVGINLCSSRTSF